MPWTGVYLTAFEIRFGDDRVQLAVAATQQARVVDIEVESRDLFASRLRLADQSLEELGHVDRC